MEQAIFEVGNTYYIQIPSNPKRRYGKILAKGTTFITCEDLKTKQVRKCKLHKNQDGEYIFPHGQNKQGAAGLMTMPAIMRAKNKLNK